MTPKSSRNVLRNDDRLWHTVQATTGAVASCFAPRLPDQLAGGGLVRRDHQRRGSASRLGAAAVEVFTRHSTDQQHGREVLQ